jgi:uncharacterized protein (TIGR02246 family)
MDSMYSRTFRVFSFLALFCAPFSVAPAYGQSDGSADEAAIRQVVRNYLVARERRDPKAVANVFTPDADQLVSTGEWRRGREELVRGTLASSESTGGHRTIAIQKIRLLAPSVAIADGPYDLTGLAGGQSRRMWTTFVLTRGSEGWRIAAIRNMRPSTPVPTK